MTNMQLYNVLKGKIGPSETEALITYVDARIKDSNEQNLQQLATKEDVKNLEVKLEVKIADVKTDIVRWMFAAFITLLLTIVGLYIRK